MLTPDRAGTIVAAILEAELASAAGAYAPVAAARLAGDLRLTAAAPALLACVAKTDDAEDPLWQESVSAVKAIGSRALEPALSAFASCRDPEGRSRLGDVLAHLSVRDDRVLDALVRNLEDDVSLAAGNLVEYGDPCALPALAAAFDAAPVEEDEPSLASNLDVIELAAAIEALGGVLTPDRRGMTPVDSVEAVGRRRAAGGNRFRAEGYSMSRYSACSLAAVATSSTKPSSDSQTRSGDDVSRACRRHIARCATRAARAYMNPAVDCRAGSAPLADDDLDVAT